MSILTEMNYDKVALLININKVLAIFIGIGQISYWFKPFTLI